MAITLQRAKALCTAGEFDLVHWSTSKRVQSLSVDRLRQKIVLARRLRDKYRGLADRQKREIKGKGSPRGATRAGDNRNTRTKQQLFQETLQRFETALFNLEGVKSAMQAAMSGGSGASVKKKSTKAAGKKAPAAKVSKVSKKKTVKRAIKSPPAPRKKTGGKKSLLDTPEQRAVEKGLIQSARKTRGATKARLLKSAWTVKSVRGVAGKTRRNQAKRDSR